MMSNADELHGLPRGQYALRMVVVLAASLACGLVCNTSRAQVQVTQAGDRIHVAIDGKPYGDLVMGDGASKPYFYPLRSVQGTVVTRGYPMEQATSESHDHQHHRGLWIGHINVSGVDFWANEVDYNLKNSGKMVLKKPPDLESGAQRGLIRLLLDWVAPSGEVLLTEDRTMIFYSGTNLRQIDLVTTLTAKTKVVFEDEKDGFMAMRLADDLTEMSGNGVIRNAQGATGMAAVWGKPSDWADYSGELHGEAVGIAIFDHPNNFRHPPRWHARDYGLFGVNPFGAHGFDQSTPVSPVTLSAGESVHLQYQILIHPKMSPETIAHLYEKYAKQ